MKKIILIFIVLISHNVSKAQNGSARYSYSPYHYDTCQYLQQFAGEWRYINGNDTIRFYFRVHKDSTEQQKAVITQLYGWHEYKQGNNIIESDYSQRFTSLPYFVDTVIAIKYSITLMGSAIPCTTAMDTLSGTIIDFSQNREMHMVKAVINVSGGIMTMNWKQRHRDGFGFLTGATGMTLPKEFILTKQ